MFKRVEKRRIKKQEEEDLGLDEDIKDVLGMHDTDSEESDSDSDESSVAGDDDDLNAEGLEGNIQNEGDDEGSDVGDEEDETGEDPMITVQEALKDPVYLVSLQPDVKACIVCPGKLLKGAKMVELHRKSNAHERRTNQFITLAQDARMNESAWDILQRNAEEAPKRSLTSIEGSKRAEKRKAKLAIFKAKREKQKAKARAKKAGLLVPATTEILPLGEEKEPAKKKRKTQTTNPASSSPKQIERPKKSVSFESTPNVTQEKPVQPTVKSIVQSTSDRARKARSRALSTGKSTKRDLKGRK